MDAETLPYALDLVASSGICLSPEKRAALRNSLLLVRRDYRFEQVRLWGRIQGTRGAYYIAEGLGPDRAGIRSRLYSLNGVDWSLLPPPSEEIIAMTAGLKGRFQGDPSYEYESSEKKEEGERPYEEEIGLLIESLQLLKLVTQLLSESGFHIDFAWQKVAKGDHMTLGHFNHHKYEQVAKHPNFDGDAVTVPLIKEEIRLVATIHQIDQEVGIVPRGAYVKSPLGPVHVNRSFEGLSLTEAKKLSSYFHFTEPVKLKNKTLLEKADLDPAIDFLDSLEHDIPKGSWSIQVERGSRVVVLRSLLWPGLTFYHIPNTKQHGYIYFGNGEKNIDLPFML